MCEFACVSMRECMCGSVCVKRFVDKNSVQLIPGYIYLRKVDSGAEWDQDCDR